MEKIGDVRKCYQTANNLSAYKVILFFDARKCFSFFFNYVYKRKYISNFDTLHRPSHFTAGLLAPQIRSGTYVR